MMHQHETAAVAEARVRCKQSNGIVPFYLDAAAGTLLTLDIPMEGSVLIIFAG